MKQLVLLALCGFSALQGAVFNVLDYGATGDGKTKDTTPIAKAIAACAKAGGGTVYLPPGRYLTGPVVLKSNMTLEIDGGATLLGSPDVADYPLRDDVWNPGKKVVAALISATDAENVTVRGRGTVDGQGSNWWKLMGWPARMKVKPENKTAQELEDIKKLANGRPHLLEFIRCKFTAVEQLHLINSPSWTIHPLLSEFVRVDGVTIENPVPSPNTDGINPESCRNVQISNCRIDVGDDCITLKSGKDAAGRKVGKPDENITITNCVMLKGHGGVVIGSEMSGGVRNVTVSNCVFQGTDVGIRVKTQRGRGGVVEGLAATNIVMQDVKSAFTITMFYAGSEKEKGAFPVDEGTPRFRDFVFSNITARGSKTAGEVTGLKEMLVENISFSNIHIDAETGMKVTDAKDIDFRDVVIRAMSGPPLTVTGSERVNAAGVTGRR